MTPILVTGGAGFIGSHLCEALLAQGHVVVSLDNYDDFYDPEVKRANLAACRKRDNFTEIEGDIRDAAKVEEVLAENQIGMIVHLAARAGVRPSIEKPLLYLDVNVRGTSVLLEAARLQGIRRFIFASSSSVYGNNEKVPFSESDNVDHPISPYAATKKAGELICHAYHHLFDMDISCLRFFTVYGARQRPDLAIHKFTRLIDQGRPIPMYGDGGMMRDFTYIDDIIAGIVAAIARCNGYHVYNLGESRPIALINLIRVIEEALGKPATIQQLPMQPGDVDRTYADVTLAQRDLDYRPSTDIRDGIARFVEWYRA